MSQRAMYILIENSEKHCFDAHWGANALSPLLRLMQAKELQEQLPEKLSLSHILAHLDYDGEYVNPCHPDLADMFCRLIAPAEVPGYMKSYSSIGDIEMRITLDLDGNNCLMEYNRHCPWYAAMDTHYIPLDIGLQNVAKLLKAAEERGMDNFGEIFSLYHRATGLEDKLEYARGYMRLEEYLDSPQAEEERRRYREVADRRSGQDVENEEDYEMEV